MPVRWRALTVMTVRGVDCRGEGGEIGDVGGDRQAAGQARGEVLQGVGVARDQGHLRAPGGQRLRGAKSDTR